MKTKVKPRYRIDYRGKILSTNQVRSQPWRETKRMKDSIQITFMALILKAKVQKLESIDLSVKYNTRHDVDGITMMLKYFVDSLVRLKKLKDDGPEYWPHFEIEFYDQLEKGTIQFEII